MTDENNSDDADSEKSVEIDMNKSTGNYKYENPFEKVFEKNILKFRKN